MQKKVSDLLLLSFFLIILSCDNTHVFDSYKSVPNKWHKDSVASFSFTAPDTTNYYNLYVNIRNTNNYKYNNLYLIVALEASEGNTTVDTLQYKMAAPDGTLLGSGFSDVKENKLWYKGFKTPFRFKNLGNYNVEIQHAMRNNAEVNGIEELEGVTDIGFRVEQKQN